MGNEFAFNIIFWIGLTFFVLFGVLLPVLLFFAALLEKRHVRTLRPRSARDASGQVVPPVVETIAAHFQPLGRYDSLAAGKKPDPIFLLLSRDGFEAEETAGSFHDERTQYYCKVVVKGARKKNVRVRLTAFDKDGVPIATVDAR